MSEWTAPFVYQLHPLLFGLNALDLWDSINLVFLSYALLAFAPRWTHTRSLTLVVPCLHSVIYIASFISAIKEIQAKDDAPLDFFTLEGVVKGFENPNIVFVGWMHYIVFDHLVSRMIVLDSIQRGASWLVHYVFVVPCMFATCMVGPTGFLTYILLRNVVLPENGSSEGGSSSQDKVKIL